MKHNRLLLYGLSFMMLLASQLVIAGGLAEDLAEDTAKSITKDITFDSEPARQAFEKGLLDALKEGGQQALDDFMVRNSKFIKNTTEFESKLKDVISAQEKTLSAARGAQKVADKALGDLKPGGDNPVEGGNDTPTQDPAGTKPGPVQGDPLTKDGLLGDAKGANAARKQYTNVARTKNLIENTEESLGKVTSDSKSAFEEYAKRMQQAKRDLVGVSKKYLKDLGNIPESTLKRLNLSSEDLERITADLKSGDRAKIEAACQKVARLKALAGIGDVDSMISNFVSRGASPAMAEDMVNSMIKNVNESFDDLSKQIADDPDFFKETIEREGGAAAKDAKGVEHGGSGSVKKTSKFSAWLDETEGSLNGAIKDSADNYLSECDLAADQLAEEGDISTFEGAALRLKAFVRNPADILKESFDSLATDFKTTVLKDKAQGAVDALGEKLDSLKGLGQKFKEIRDMLLSAVVFMVPNIFQSTFLAEQQKAAAMASWGSPIKFGEKVYQIPDSCINLENPSNSWPIYAQIPVNDVDEEISSSVASLFGDSISGPTTDNALSRAIHGAGAEVFSFGTVTETQINRFEMDESKFLPQTDIVVVYGGPGAYVTPGSVSINNSQFTGQLISLTTGSVSDATGEIVDATGLAQSKSVPLVQLTQPGALSPSNTSPISQGLEAEEDFLPSILSRMEAGATSDTFTAYSNIGSGSEGKTASQVVEDLFDTSCILPDGSLTSADCGCVILKGLEQLSSGMIIQSGGQASTVFHVGDKNPLKVSKSSTPVIVAAASKSNLGNSLTATPLVRASNRTSALGRLSVAGSAQKATSKSAQSKQKKSTSPAAQAPAQAAWDGLGAVLPIFGWGTNEAYNTIFAPNAFPGFDPSSAGISGIASIGSIGSENMVNNQQSTTSDQSTVFASADEVWVAKGCWIYLSTNTPFIQYLQQKISTPLSLKGSYVDYIVFMDQNAEIVPMMVPVTVDVEVGDSSYKKTQMGLNPDIVYWASLVAYNLPAFAELDPTDGQMAPVMYGLRDNKVYPYSGLGALANAASTQNAQGPSGAIPTFLNAISSGFSDIYNQFLLHSSALIYLANNMPNPYANCSLTSGPANILTTSDNGKKATVTTYTGLNCWESSVGGDYLIPLESYQPGVSGGNPTLGAIVTLPDTQAQYLVSLVTDIVYQLENNAWVPFDFTNSMLQLDANNMPIKNKNGSYAVNIDAESDFYFASGYSLATPAVGIIGQLQKLRTAWLKNMSPSLQIGTPGAFISCTLASGLSMADARSSKSYIYQLNPSPTATMLTQQDYFVAVAASSTVNNLIPVDLITAAKNPNGYQLVSLLTGMLFDMTGAPILHQDGLPKRIALNAATAKGNVTTAQFLYNYIRTQFTKLPKNFLDAYKASVDAYENQQLQPQGPYIFGSIKVAIRNADLADGTYVYFNASNMYSTQIQPKDLYVVLTVNQSGTGYILSQYDPTQTQYLLSLITGAAYDQNGQLSMTLDPQQLQKMIATWSKGWSPWILNNLSRLQESYEAKIETYQESNAQVEKEINNFVQEHETQTNAEKQQIAAIIKRLQPKSSGLPVPFPGLQYDAQTKQYVHPSPAGTSVSNGLIYLFLGSGKVYGEDGTYHTRYTSAHLKAVRDEYGVVVDPQTEQQKLGVPMMQPSLSLSDADKNLKIGESSASMIASTDANFPGNKVKMPAGFGLFFSKIMDTYYVLNTQDQWMSVDGGHLYQKNGRSIIDGRKVAFFGSGSDNIMLLYENSNGYPQAFMSDGCEYSNLSNSATNMNWMGLSEPFTQLQVTANEKMTAYTISGKQYRVNPDYRWYSLVLVPINDDGELLATIPSSSYRTIELVKDIKEDKITHVLYHGAMYKVIASTANTYTLKALNAQLKLPNITIKADLFDSGTDAAYLTITDKTNTYKYCYTPQLFTTEEQESNRANIWSGTTSASPMPLLVGPMHEQTKEILGKTVTIPLADYITHTMFTRDLPTKNGAPNLAPVSISSVSGAPTQRSNPKAYDTLQIGLANVFETVGDNRFVYPIGAWTQNPAAGVLVFPYVSKASYVDLKTGALFDAVTGLAIGQALNMGDLLKVLDTCSIMITEAPIAESKAVGKKAKSTTKDTAGKNIMVYRSASVIQQQKATIEENYSQENN